MATKKEVNAKNNFTFFNPSNFRKSLKGVAVDVNYEPKSFKGATMEQRLKTLGMTDYTKGLYANGERIDNIKGDDKQAGLIRFMISSLPEQQKKYIKAYAKHIYENRKEVDNSYSQTNNDIILTELQTNPSLATGHKGKTYYSKLSKSYNYWYHQYELVKTGQAVDIRMNNFKELYLKTLKENNMPKDIINKVKSMSGEAIYKKTIEPNADKLREATGNSNKFPKVENVYVLRFTKGGEEFEEIVTQMRETLAITDFDIDITDPFEGSVFRAVGRARNQGSFSANMELLANTRGFYTEDTGQYYIPFVGSTKGNNDKVKNWIKNHADEVNWRKVSTYRDIYKK